MGYDASGNVTSTTLKSNTSSFTRTLNSAATYTSNNNLVASVTDTAKQKESYTYGDKQSVMTGQATSVKDANGNVTTTSYNNMGRVSEKGFANKGILRYNYQEGLLSSVIRTDDTGRPLPFVYNHDSFGNLTGIEVGGISLASYEYGEKNGNLMNQTYGNGDSVSFEYDHLGRVVTSTYSSGRTLDYTYTGDGQLYSIVDNHATSDKSDDTTYTYTYDTLGRVINCQVCQGIQVLLQVHWEYDEFNRVSSQGWQMGTASYKEAFEYSKKDGSLVSIATEGGGNSIQLAYDPLQRLSSVSNGVFTRAYTYKDISAAQTTSQVQKVQYSGLSSPLNGLSYSYTYNTLGNIASVAKGNAQADTYSYDAMGQLVSANLGVDDLNFNYTYDSTGNLKQVTAQDTSSSSENYTNNYTYGNSSWADLLTGFNGEPIFYEGQSLGADGTITGTPNSGNPIRYFNGTRWSFDWAEGQNLVSAETSTGSVDTGLSFAYDANGLRTEKKSVTKTYDVVLVHDYVTTVVAPTCVEKGYTLHACDCGYSYRSDETPALGHDYVETSLETYTCTRCGDTYSDHVHSYTSTVVPPTCEEDGYTLHECACGHSYRDNPIDKLGHDYEKIKETTTEAFYKCARCGAEYSSPIYIIEPPYPPVVQSISDDNAAPVGCTVQRTLISTVTEEHNYIYASGKLLRETITGGGTTKTLDFRYDNVGFPYALIYSNGSSTAIYYYITNLQGDVMYLVDSNGNQVAEYTYDPYGKVLSSSGAMAEINPLRYRGYYQDEETGFCYLQSRYYDPAICRFISADDVDLLGANGDFASLNLFAYCGNNPVIRADSEGTFWHIVGGAVLGAVAGTVTKMITNAISGQKITDGLLTAGIAGAVSGGLAASGVGLVGQVVGNALIGAGNNAADQLIGMDNGTKADGFDVGSMLLDGVIGAVAGFAGGAGAGNRGLTKIGLTNVKRTLNGLTHKGAKAALKVLGRGLTYFEKMQSTWSNLLYTR